MSNNKNNNNNTTTTRTSSQLFNKRPEEQIAGDVDIATTSASRAIYLAGFTYLRLRLYASTPTSDVRFLTFISASFCLSVLSAAMSLIFKFFLDRCQTIEQKIAFNKNSREFYVKGAYYCFLLALILFCTGLSRIGWVYFAGWNTKYISFVLFLFGAASIIITTFYIGTTRRSILNSSSTDDRAYLTTDTSQTQRNGESLDVFLSKQMDVLIERSIFIGGIAINGVTFYVEVLQCQNLGRSYLFFMSLSAICTLYVSGILSTLRIALQDFPSGSTRIRYAYLVLPLGQICFIVYILSFLFLIIGLMFIGYGVHYTRDKYYTLVINTIGAGGLLFTLFYAGYSHAISLKLVQTPSPTASTSNSAERGGGGGDGDKKMINGMKITEEEHVKSTLTSSKLMGSICNITSGFVFFNLLFYSGVLNNEQKGTETQSRIYLISNALALILCIIISVLDSILQLFTNDLETFAHRSCFLLKMNSIISFTQFGTFVAMGCVFVSYGLGAIVKFHPNSYIPAYTSGVGGFMILVGVAVFSIQRQRLPIYMKRLEEKEKMAHSDSSTSSANGNPMLGKNSTSSMSNSSSNSQLPSYKAERYAKRPSVLSILTGCVMFFGGFAYTAIINLSYDDKPVENRFVAFMSLIFIFSYSIVVWGIFYLLFFSSCSTPKEKILYVIVTSPVYKTALVLSGLALLSTIIGFCLMGYTKTYAENYSAFSATMIGAAAFSSLLVMAILGIVYTDYKSVTEATKHQHLEESSHNMSNLSEMSRKSDLPRNGNGSEVSSGAAPTAPSSPSPSNDNTKVLLNQLSTTVASASFIAGNILYELLFVNPLYRYGSGVTLSYIIFAALTFTSAVSAVVITNITLFLIGTLTTKEGSLLADKLVNHGIQLFVFSFTLSALLTWMTAAALLPHVIFQQSIENRWPLTVFCMVAIVMIIYSIYKAYSLVLEVTEKGKEMERETESKVISDL